MDRPEKKVPEEPSIITDEECERADAAENKRLCRKGKISEEQKMEIFLAVKNGQTRKSLIRKYGLSYYKIGKIVKECLAHELKALEAQELAPQ